MTTLAFIEYPDRFEVAADSRISFGNRLYGNTKKIHKVHEKFGGGIVMSCGDSEWGQKFCSHYADTGEMLSVPEKVDIGAVRVNSKGASFSSLGAAWVPFSNAFFSEGSGSKFALGAIHAGAKVDDAVRIACELDDSSGGEVDVHIIQKEGHELSCASKSSTKKK